MKLKGLRLDAKISPFGVGIQDRKRNAERGLVLSVHYGAWLPIHTKQEAFRFAQRFCEAWNGMQEWKGR